MIERLAIRGFALVDELCLEFSPGFTVLTGETGAGKSILLQALWLLLGDRACREAVRTGAEQARVEGTFAPVGPRRAALARVLDEGGVPWSTGGSDPEPLVLARILAADGRSRAFVNGSSVPLALLERVGAALVELSSQHQHQGLLREEGHLALLDASLGPEGLSARETYREAYAAWVHAAGEVRRLEALESQARERGEVLRFQAGELRALGVVAGEEERLREEREILAHAEKLLEAYAAGEEEIYAGTDASLVRLGRAARAVEGARRRDPAAAGILEVLAEAKASLEEAALRLRERQRGLHADPRRLEALESRLEAIARLERKHGLPADALPGKLEALEAELLELENREFALEKARKALAGSERELEGSGAALTKHRGAAAGELSARVGRELEALALGRSSFQVELGPCSPGASGADQARFLLAPNPGEPPRPLARIASGGELSRVLLALKNALRDSAVETLIFDEVDAGIGGAVADSVADRLSALAASCQVICITHLPQIASRASHHWKVEKGVETGRTVTRVRPLQGQERIEELARMLAGRNVTELSREHARELVGRMES
ncbi:MAG: DNA repair protein RecN [Deltaproteobacteria bacterium]|nr:DNA repair protein RecN [Deltaproteobacteria bacterium]